jgi:hypothetical protein
MHYNILFAVVVIFCFHSVNAIEFKNCGSYFLFDNIQIEGCDDDATSCQLTIGSNTSISFTINTGKPYDEFNIDAALLNDVSLNVRGTKFNLNVTPDDPCEVLLCPLSTNYSATYSAEVYIDTIFQPLNAELQWILETADAEEKLLCFLCQITLVNAKSV